MAMVAYFIWSCFPFYFKLLGDYGAVEIIVHRIVWTLVALSAFMFITRRRAWLDILRDNPKWLLMTFLSGLLIATNWLTYVWAVNADKILDASLGYFMSPLAGIALSFFVLKERLRPLQLLAIALAALAVLLQIVLLGVLPMVAFLLAFTFSVYGLMQRKTPLDAVSGLFLETLLLVPFCVAYLMMADTASSALSFWLSKEVSLLMLAGPVTLVPLLLYNGATKLVSFNSLSFMQYVTPLSIFLIAVFYYGEPFDMKRLSVFALIWLGLVIFSVDLIRHKKVQNKSKT